MLTTIAVRDNEPFVDIHCHLLPSVDDGATSWAETLAMALQVSGYETRTVHTAGEALEIAAVFRPEVALLDIGLPDMNGYELARKIRREPWGGKIALIAATGWGQEADRQRALSLFDQAIEKLLAP